MIDLLFVCVCQIGVLVELRLQPLYFLEAIDELCPGVVPFQVGNFVRLALQPLRLHELVQVADGLFQLLNDPGGLVDQPDFAGLVFGLRSGEQRDGFVDVRLLIAEIENMPVRLSSVEHAIGPRERLNQPVVFQVFVDIERVEIFGIEASQQHINHDCDINLFRPFLRHVVVRILLVLDTLLHVLVVEVEFVDGMVGSIPLVVVSNDGFQCFLFDFGVDPYCLPVPVADLPGAV